MEIKGFSASAVAAGIRYPDRLDLGLIYSERPALAVGAFTTNQVKAAPVQLDRERLRQEGRAQAILVNSGNANACTGREGMQFARQSASLAANALGIKEELVQVASTGVIGEPLDLAPFADNMTTLVENLSPQGFEAFSQAIMTTDTRPKVASAMITIGGTRVSILGIAKGAGMIMPDMATMLCFLLSDAQIVFPVLKQITLESVEQTFNRITVDGDTSTNDTVLMLANGMAGNSWIDENTPTARESFAMAVQTVMKDLALQIVADGEGATKLVTLRIRGARDADLAMQAAQAIANSQLVKTAFFGEDANWGRIMAALGRSGCHFFPERVAISFDNVLLVRNGLSLGKEAEEEAAAVLRQPEFTVTVDLNDGREGLEVYTCDLSLDYVRINADYRS